MLLGSFHSKTRSTLARLGPKIVIRLRDSSSSSSVVARFAFQQCWKRSTQHRNVGSINWVDYPLQKDAVHFENRRQLRPFSSDQDDDEDDNNNDDYVDDEDVTPGSTKKKLEALTFKDYDVSFLQDLVERGELDLQPFYQRDYKWTQKQASIWIESILRGYPCVPEIILLKVGEDGEEKDAVFDGQQRLTSTILFLKGQRGSRWPKRRNDNSFRLEKLPLLKDFEGKTYRDLPKDKQNAIKNFGIRCAIIPASWEMSDYIDFFTRIQGGGTPMTFQELRRVLSQGPFTELLDELSKEEIVETALDGFPKLQCGNDEVQELLLRHFQYQRFREKFAKPTLTQKGLETMKKFNKEMKSWTKEEFSTRREQLKRPLMKSLELIISVFGTEEAFRRPEPLMKKGKVVSKDVPSKLWVDQMTIRKPLWDCTVNAFANEEILKREYDIRKNSDVIRSALVNIMQTNKLFTDTLRSSDISARIRLFETEILAILDSAAGNSMMTRRNLSSQQRKDLIKVAREQNQPCNICKQPLGPFDEWLHIDHIHPISKGGTDDPNNLQVVHKTCNLRKSNKIE